MKHNTLARFTIGISQFFQLPFNVQLVKILPFSILRIYLYTIGVLYFVLAYKQTFKIDSVFEKREGFASSIGEINEDDENNKVSVSMSSGRHIYNLLVNRVENFNDENMRMYTFNNITISEYQNLTYSNFLKIVNQLVRFKIGYINNIEQIEEQLNNIKQIADLTWLKQKVEKLM